MSEQQQEQLEQPVVVQQQQRKNVSFGGKRVTTHVYPIPNARKLTKKEKSKMWLSTEEFLMIRDNCHDEIEILDDAEEFDIFKFRGLEMVARDAKGIKQVQESIYSVLKEQQKQRTEFQGMQVYKPKSIRKVYKELTAESSRAALENAYIDQMAIKEYVQNTEEDLKKEMIAQLEKQRQEASKKLAKRSSFGQKQLMKSVKQVRRSFFTRRTAPLVAMTA